MCALNQKPVAIGYEDFKRIIEEGLYYVDKTAMIKDFLDGHASVTLFTRPRRFGKTLNLSMLRRFFEDERKEDGTPVDNRALFDGLYISRCGEDYFKHQQQYPVISLSLKSAKQPDYAQAHIMLKRAIIGEFERHAYVLACDRLTAQEKEIYQSILHAVDDKSLYADGLRTLSICLEKYHGKKCIILIDEYDVPLENAWFQGFYDEMIGFIRSLFESALKTNSALAFGVITGCLRISKESIFTGLNNMQVNSVQGDGYGDAFGFTQEEVKTMLNYYEMSDYYGEMQQYYDGYRFDQAEIYNPWSILNYVNDHRHSAGAMPTPYWSNTSSNSIVRELVEGADQHMRGEIERLIAGEFIEKPVHGDITYGDIHTSTDNLWNFLYFTGYLTSAGQRYDGENTFIKLVIPNTEVRTIYRRTILSWFDGKLKSSDLAPLIRAIEEGDCETIADVIGAQLMETISFFDYGESYYHGFLAGLLRAAGGSKYEILSNRESGEGRPDLVMREMKFRGRAMILELKVAGSFGEMEDLCREALSQIATRQYEEGLRQEGCREVLNYGICFFRKGCLVMKEEAEEENFQPRS